MRMTVFMHSKPAIGREFYSGKVDVHAETIDEAVQRAIDSAARTHGHRDWHVKKVEVKP